MGVLVSIVVYLVALVVACSVIIKIMEKKRAKHKDEFALGGRSLTMPVVGITIALTNLGAVHVFGLMEMGFMMGFMAIWFVMGIVCMLVIICTFTGWLVRKYDCASMSEFIAYVFGQKMRVIVTCATAGVIWGFMTLEAQGLGIVFEAFTGYGITTGIFIGATISVLYVLLGGMKEISYANVVNSVVMYIGVILGVVIMGFVFPGGGWGSVNDFFINNDQGFMLSIMGNTEFVLTFGLPLALVVIFSQGMNQSSIIVCASAKNASTVKKAVFIAVLVNCCFGPFTLAIGMAAKSMPEFAALGPKLGATKMLIEMLPTWALVILVASFISAIVSTYAISALTLAASFTKDIYVPCFKPKASEKEQVRLIRIMIVLLAALGWISSFLAPVFCLFIYGLLWKRSKKAAVITIIVAWIINILWSFTSLPEITGIGGNISPFITIGTGFILGAILTAVMPGKLAFFKVYRNKNLAETRALDVMPEAS